MRAPVRSILAILVWGCASTALADEPDAGAGTPSQKEAEAAPPAKAEDKHPRLVKPEGDREDNEQLGGEPSLTETQQEPAANGDRETSTDEAPAEDDCDLDCLEAQLAKEEDKEQRKKGTLRVARESGSITEETGEDSGDTLSAEPSTTSLAEAEVGVPEDRTLPMRLGPVRIKVGKSEDWIGIGFATQLEFQYEQQFQGAGFENLSTETLEFRRIRTTLSSSFIAVSYTHLTLPTIQHWCRSRWSPYH